MVPKLLKVKIEFRLVSVFKFHLSPEQRGRDVYISNKLINNC